jgi:putative flavoprotein involved in K+ transport
VFEKYLDRVAPVYKEHVEVISVDRTLRGTYQIQTNIGAFETNHIIVATGMYSNPYIPQEGSGFGPEIKQLHSSEYKNPDQLQPGNVLVVGSGWSGIQIALEIKQTTEKDVFLSIGSMQPLPTVYRNINGVYWLNRLSGYKKGKPVLTYHMNDFENHNIVKKLNQNLGQCQKEGVHIVGRFKGVNTREILFAKSLLSAFEDSDVYMEAVKKNIERHIEAERMEVPEGTLDRTLNVVDRSKLSDIEQLDLIESNISNVIWSTGFRRDYSYMNLPIFDGQGLPILVDGVQSSENVYFCSLGLEVDKKLKSAFGVGLYAIDESAERTVQAVLSRMKDGGI